MTGEEKYQRAVAQVLGKLKGRTQAQIAEAAGISQPYYQRIVTGKKTPSPDVLDRLATLAGGNLAIEFRREKKSGNSRK